VALAAVLAAPSVPGRATATSDDPLDEARKAAAQTPFSGSVTLEWRDGTVLHQEHLVVRGSHGSVLAEGGREALAVGAERLVYDQAGGWRELWPSGLGTAGHPSLGGGYQTREMGSGRVAGYDTRTIEIRKNGVVRERLQLDVATGLVLSRLQFDAGGATERGFTFDRVRVPDPTVAAPAMPPSPKRDGPRSLSPRSVPASERVPTRLADGYRRVGAYTQGGVLQLVYGDGLYDLSLFQQQGRMEPNDRPARTRSARVEGRRAWQFSWPGGEGVVWTAGDTVYTLMGDVPPDELLQVAASVPLHPTTSVTHRLRQACRALVESFSGKI